jgi:hypothetical protein
MKKFFDRLFELKDFIKKKHAETKIGVLKEVYDKLDAAIKSKEEKNK